jgi:hypothetical protein
MSAFDTLPEKEFVQIMPGIMAMFSKKRLVEVALGYLVTAHRLSYPTCLS